MGSATRGATRNWQRIQAVHLNPDQTDTRQERLLTLLSWLPSSPFAGEAPRRFGKIRASWLAKARRSARTTCKSAPLPWPRYDTGDSGHRGVRPPPRLDAGRLAGMTAAVPQPPGCRGHAKSMCCNISPPQRLLPFPQRSGGRCGLCIQCYRRSRADCFRQIGQRIFDHPRQAGVAESGCAGEGRRVICRSVIGGKTAAFLPASDVSCCFDCVHIPPLLDGPDVRHGFLYAGCMPTYLYPMVAALERNSRQSSTEAGAAGE